MYFAATLVAAMLFAPPAKKPASFPQEYVDYIAAQRQAAVDSLLSEIGALEVEISKVTPGKRPVMRRSLRKLEAKLKTAKATLDDPTPEPTALPAASPQDLEVGMIGTLEDVPFEYASTDKEYGVQAFVDTDLYYLKSSDAKHGDISGDELLDGHVFSVHPRALFRVEKNRLGSTTFVLIGEWIPAEQ